MTSRIEFRCINKEQIKTLSNLLCDDQYKVSKLIDDIQSSNYKRMTIDKQNVYSNCINLAYLKECIILSVYENFNTTYCKIYPDGRYKYFEKNK